MLHPCLILIFIVRNQRNGSSIISHSHSTLSIPETTLSLNPASTINKKNLHLYPLHQKTTKQRSIYSTRNTSLAQKEARKSKVCQPLDLAPFLIVPIVSKSVYIRSITHLFFLFSFSFFMKLVFSMVYRAAKCFIFEGRRDLFSGEGF